MVFISYREKENAFFSFFHLIFYFFMHLYHPSPIHMDGGEDKKEKKIFV